MKCLPQSKAGKTKVPASYLQNNIYLSQNNKNENNYQNKNQAVYSFITHIENKKC